MIPLTSIDLQLTGPPPFNPFSQQKRTPEPVTVTPGQEPGSFGNSFAPSMHQKGAPHYRQEPGTSSTTAPPAVNTPTTSRHLVDHDYFRQPSAVSDHTYARPLPERPPPGFEHYRPEGRPKRNIKFPSKFDDYDMN